MSKTRVELYEEVQKDGRCKYRMPYKDELTGRWKTVSILLDKQSASNYKLAKRLLEERIDDILTNTKPDNFSLKRLLGLYLDDKARTLKESTLIRNKATLSRLFKWMGEDSLINNLSIPYVRNTIMSHSEENYTYNEYLARFKAFLNWAYTNDYLTERTLIDKLKPLPDNKKARIEDKYLEREELKKLLDNSESVPHWHHMIHFMALSGLRVGEVISLRDSDIDNDYIHVRSTYQINADKFDTPKTESSNRDVYLRKELKDLVSDIRKYIRKYKFENGCRSDLFMCNSKGTHLDYYAFNKYLKELSNRVLGRTITTHALRHTAASLLIADGVPLETVSRMLGHESSQITKDIYFHITEQLRERDNAILDNAKVL